MEIPPDGATYCVERVLGPEHPNTKLVHENLERAEREAGGAA